MKTAVRYQSQSGNTKKVAQVIARTLGVKEETVATPIDEQVDILFVGGGIYAGKMDSSLKDFIDSLTSDKVKSVAVFSTSAGKTTLLKQVTDLLEPKGIKVYEDDFHSKGKFLLVNRGRPSEDELKESSAFAKKILNSAN